ncbi:nicotinamide riboside kinase 1 isoform X2 [Archocentrus centrarchus]|uniref:nicotinamide riboside kinase 1 isoform X2 n=1 Tax=Archocentrus centrarchus TaxID=63155 RepID=UPI0011E9E8D9|nr:nicotinamide riboside kinase 1-like isoform X2 [Archocentrus centrarchus]
MKTLIVGIGGVTNGGKTTLANSLQEQIPNSCIIAQDSYFKDDCDVPVDSSGFKQYDILDALHMQTMIRDVDLWQRDPESFLRQQGLKPQLIAPSIDKEVFVLIVEGFLIFNHRPLNELFDKKYFMEIPYDACKRRRSSRAYMPPDPPGYFSAYVWPMYLKNREEMESIESEFVFLDGLKTKEELLAAVYEDICQEIERLREKN